MADITFTGNVGNVELRFTPGGKAVLNISVAENHRKRDGNAWVDDGTTWWRVAVWERQAETLAEVLNKGDRVLVVGQVKSREYEKDGAKVTAYDVNGRQVAVVPKAGAVSAGPAPDAGAWGAPF